MNKSIILDKIKSYYNLKKDSDFARMLGISPQNLSNWKKRNTYDPQLVYTKCVEINSEWLLTGKGSMLKSGYPQTDPRLPATQEPDSPAFSTKKLQTIPLYNLDTLSGLSDLLKNNSINIPQDFIKIPDFTDCEGAIYVKGDSMQPLLKSGDIVAFKKISLENVFWGELYLVEVAIDNEGSFIAVRYLQKSELGSGFIKLVSENPNYQAKDIAVDKIKAIALIRASIRLH